MQLAATGKKNVRTSHLAPAMAMLVAALCNTARPDLQVDSEVNSGRSYEETVGHVWTVSLRKKHAPKDCEV